MVRYSEIFLKTDPVRHAWENRLIANILDVMPGARAQKERGRIWLYGDVNPALLKNIFGIVSFSRAERTGTGGISAVLPDYCMRHGFGAAETFAIRVRRVGTHPFTSGDKAIEYGNLIRETFPHLKVDLVNPEKELFIEIRENDAYLYDSVTRAAGGLPLGVEGTLVALLSGGIDSPVAAWMMMKRGCRVLPLFVALDTFLDKSTIARAERVVAVLKRFQPDISLTVVHDPFLARAKDELVRRHLEKFTCIVCKRRMYRIAAAYAGRAGAKGIVTGESLGQVASQTLDNLLVLTDAAEIPVYRPLIGFDKEEVIRIAREIGTFSESISPASGCKAVPKGPSTAARLGMILDLEAELEAAKMPVPL